MFFIDLTDLFDFLPIGDCLVFRSEKGLTDLFFVSFASQSATCRSSLFVLFLFVLIIENVFLR